MPFQEIFLALVGAGFAIAGPVRLLQLREGWGRRTRRVTGEVVRHEAQTVHGPDATGLATQHAAVRYEVDGRSFVAVSRYGASWRTSSVGDRRVVVYDPREPSDGEVFSETGRQAELLIFAAATLAGVALAATFGMKLLA